MAKKIVRGITDVKTINNQDFDTNNVNDLLSDGQYSYIHRKKGKSEEYHNLTDNIKTISSDNTDLLTVTNNNKTNNTATLHPKHDAQKEQVLESTRNTVNIHHGTNGTDEKTTVDTNPAKVLEHENLTVGSGLVKSHTAEQNTTNLSVDFNTVQQKMSAGDGLTISNNKISIKPTHNGNPLNNGFYMGNITDDSTDDSTASSIISLQSESNRIVQIAFRESALTTNLMIMRYRFVNDGTPTNWKLAAIDNEQLLSLLSQKQNKLTAMGGVSITGDSISLTVLDRYSGDLNSLIYTCKAKPIDNAPNLPTGVYGNGILTVTRIGDVVSQQYHAFNNMIYYRTARYADGAPGNVPEWKPWVKVTTTALS